MNRVAAEELAPTVVHPVRGRYRSVVRHYGPRIIERVQLGFAYCATAPSGRYGAADLEPLRKLMLQPNVGL